MSIREKFANKKMKRALENEYLVLVDVFIETKGSVKRRVMPSKVAIEILRTQCFLTRDKLKRFKELNNDMFLKYADRYKRVFEDIDRFITSLSNDLTM